MQLKKGKSIRGALAAATCAVLSPGTQAADSDQWQLDSGLLFYTEEDRVTVVEPMISATRSDSEGGSVTVRGIFDAITGASPNGATPTNVAQTFTSPSGNAYTVAAGETPMRDTEDLRASLGIDWTQPLHQLLSNTFSANLSAESDHLSVSLSDTLSRAFNNKLTTLDLGLSFSHEVIDPDGGNPAGLRLLSSPLVTTGSESRSTSELLFGITQVLSRRALMQLNYSVGYSDGYHSDPYKIISVVNGVTGQTVDYRFEQRPDNRLSNRLYWKLAYQLPEDVVHLSYRYFQDDWGVKAHTFDLKYRLELGGESYLQPHLRYHSQNSADLFHYHLIDGAVLPENASADLRLAESQTATIGLKLGIPTEAGEFTLRAEYIQQQGDETPGEAIGIQRNYSLHPELDAYLLQLGYSFDF